LQWLGYAYIAVTPPTEPDNRQIQQVLTKYEDGPPTAEELLELVNAERSKVGVQPLKLDARLNQSAQWKADDMVTYSYFGHVKPSETGMNGVQKGYDLTRAVDGKSECNEVSENITDNTVAEDNYSQMSFYSWKSSPPHYKAMINPEYTLTGFGVSGTKVVQHFCITR
jgi:uncharacterized protein YkwD